MPDVKKSILVPANLPFLQLNSDVVIRREKDSYDSVYDFCQEFVTILEAHSLSLDDNWERLLPICLSKEDRSWFEDKLKNKALNWKMAESKLLDKYDTPFRKFLNMGRVWSMKQEKGESARAFGSKFQKYRRQAGLEDGVQLVLCFWWNLRQEVREACLIPLSANYGTKLPSKIEDIIDLVSATTRDSSSLLTNPGESKSAAVAGEFSGDRKGKKRASVGEDRGKSKKSWTFNQALKKKQCYACHAPWVPGHNCPGRERNAQEKVSRMAVRSGVSDSESGASASKWASCNDENTSALANMALKTYSLLDCGATFSSVDVEFCLKNKIEISYIEHINKNLVNKSNFHKFFIRLADSKSFVKRIGTCKLSVTCNNQTIQREFEVMNLTNSNEYDLSIGTDFMSSLGIGIYGLPMTFDDQDSNEERLEADRRFNNRSDLLDSIQRENESKENNPALGPQEFEKVMDYINQFIDENQAIPKGSFCTIPESVVCLDTPENATAYRAPYPIPIAMQEVVDKQVQEWLDNGIIEKAPANTAWNTPLTVVS
ncbi:hypothetical protein BD560DRAFT_338543, partial [Blakeslea trispora]